MKYQLSQICLYPDREAAAVAVREKLLSLRERIMFLQQQPVERQFGLDSLELLAEKLDKELVLKSQDYRQNKVQYQVTWDKVRDKLKKNEVAIPLKASAAILLSPPRKIPLKSTNQQPVEKYFKSFCGFLWGIVGNCVILRRILSKR